MVCGDLRRMARRPCSKSRFPGRPCPARPEPQWPHRRWRRNWSCALAGFRWRLGCDDPKQTPTVGCDGTSGVDVGGKLDLATKLARIDLHDVDTDLVCGNRLAVLVGEIEALAIPFD